MTDISGIKLDESLLLYNTILMTVLFIIAVGCIILLVAVNIRAKKTKESKRIQKLKKAARDDINARRELDRRLRKRRNRRNHTVKSELAAVALIVILAAVSTVMLVFCVIPGWTDFIKKDYVVYNGEFEITQRYSGKGNTFIDLSDGKVIKGHWWQLDNVADGTVVYAKRSEYLVGIKTDAD